MKATKPRRFEIIVIAGQPIARSTLLNISKASCDMWERRIPSSSIPLSEVEPRKLMVVHITSDLSLALLGQDIGMWFEATIFQNEKVVDTISFFLKHGASVNFNDVECIQPPIEYFAGVELQNMWN